jgi:hypothetical protein
LRVYREVGMSQDGRFESLTELLFVDGNYPFTFILLVIVLV